MGGIGGGGGGVEEGWQNETMIEARAWVQQLRKASKLGLALDGLVSDDWRIILHVSRQGEQSSTRKARACEVKPALLIFLPLLLVLLPF